MSLYRMDNCDEMRNCFYDTLTGLIDYYLLLRTVKRHTTDKPWVIDQFRRLIRCLHNAWRNNQTERYRSYRNRVQRMSKKLQQKYYARKIEGLQVSDPRNWWRSVTLITG